MVTRPLMPRQRSLFRERPVAAALRPRRDPSKVAVMAIVALWLAGVLSSVALAQPAKSEPAKAEPTKAALTKGKKSKKGKKANQAALASMLGEKSDEVQKCAIQRALEQGARRVEVATKVTINNKGQVIDVHTNVKVDGRESEGVRTCVDNLIRSIQFPPNDAPIITIERNWTIAG